MVGVYQPANLDHQVKCRCEKNMYYIIHLQHITISENQTIVHVYILSKTFGHQGKKKSIHINQSIAMSASSASHLEGSTKMEVDN